MCNLFDFMGMILLEIIKVRLYWFCLRLSDSRSNRSDWLGIYFFKIRLGVISEFWVFLGIVGIGWFCVGDFFF